jgi:dimethylhistidine N-methyltransferase
MLSTPKKTKDIMKTAPASPRFKLISSTTVDRRVEFAQAVGRGLTSKPKWLPCCYFYDEEGSRLFEEICELPEYYLPRAEREILTNRAPELAGRFTETVDLVELGSGNAVKTRLLIEALLRHQERLRYVPIDICRAVLDNSARGLLEAYPELEVVAVEAEYQEALRYLQLNTPRAKLILWLGSNVGNFDRTEAGAFLRQVSGTLAVRDRLLVGSDLRKDATVLQRAYDDAHGVTAAFNLNLLARINRELGGRFDLAAFQHRAVYNDPAGRIEMYLVSRRARRVRIDNLDLDVGFSAGEAIHTENSYKYSLEEIDTLASTAGLRIEAQWLDSRRQFSVNLMRLASA